MINTKQLLDLTIKIINQLEGTDFGLFIDEKEYSIIEPNRLIVFDFEKRSYLQIQEIELYFSEIMYLYPYLSILTEEVHILYNEKNSIVYGNDLLLINRVIKKIKLQKEVITNPSNITESESFFKLIYTKFKNHVTKAERS